MIKYLINVIRHKWFVFLEACKLGVPFLGIIHDISKFLPDEFFPYARYDFANFGNNKPETQLAFDKAWLKHQKRNKHHWQYWLLMNDSGGAIKFPEKSFKQVEPLPMPEKYIKELVADWKGAGRAYGNPDTKGWYKHNKPKIILHQETEKCVEELLT
jgi:hypothetical protein